MANLSDAMRHLWNNLNDLCANNPKKYEEFMANASLEHEKLSADPEPHACLEIFCEKTGARFYLNLLSWKRVEIPKNDPDALPLAGGILQQNSSIYVATRPDLIDEHFVNVSPSFKEHFMQIVFDFLEHQNPDQRFSRQWALSKENFIGSKAEMVASFSPALTTSLNPNKELLASPISLVQKIRHGSDEHDKISPMRELPSLTANPEEDEKNSSPKSSILIPKPNGVALKCVQTRKLQPLVPLFGRKQCSSEDAIYYKVYLPEIRCQEDFLCTINNQTNHLIVQTNLGHALSTPIFPVEPECKLGCAIDQWSLLNHVLTICIKFNKL